MITIKDNTGTSTLHITNNGGSDYVPTVVYELEIGKINTKLDKHNTLDNLVTKEQVQEELDKIRDNN